MVVDEEQPTGNNLVSTTIPANPCTDMFDLDSD